MDDLKYQLRRKKRGGNCIFSVTMPNGTQEGRLCGCGQRHEQDRKSKRRIAKRNLQKLDREEFAQYIGCDPTGGL